MYFIENIDQRYKPVLNQGTYNHQSLVLATVPLVYYVNLARLQGQNYKHISLLFHKIVIYFIENIDQRYKPVLNKGPYIHQSTVSTRAQHEFYVMQLVFKSRLQTHQLIVLQKNQN